ncbi:MAG: hypothetical protein ACREQY_24655 [Candidatus Binatia bacterium]
MRIADQILALHQALATAGVDHAFGGALALAWCTQQARGTIDIDLNLFLAPEEAARAFGAMPPGVTWDDNDVEKIAADGQARLWWDTTPIDVFFNTTVFHERIATRVRWEPFAGQELPFLACRDLAVFKAIFNRTRDWADLEAMAEAGTLDREAVLGVLVDHLGPEDVRVARLRSLDR